MSDETNNNMPQYLFYLLLLITFTACQNQPQPTAPVAPETNTTVQVAPAPQPAPAPSNNGSMTNMDPRDLEIPEVDQSILLQPAQLAGQITQAVNSMYPNWVLLENGTYIVFDDQGNIPDMATKALDLLEKYRPKNEEDSYWMYSISNLTNIDGWSVYGNGYGIYTYVYPSEMLKDNPSMPDIAAFAKAKRRLDEDTPKVVYTHTAESGLKTYTN